MLSEPLGTDTAGTERAITAEWEDVRCRQCRRLLAKNTRDALRPGQMLELKCASCNAFNYIVGRVTD